MKKTELIEAISWIIQEELSLVLEDEALRLSDKRRKEFLATVLSNPPSHNSRGHLNEEGILPDNPGAVPGDSAPVDASPDLGEPMDAGAPAGQTSDMGDALGGGGAAPTGAPGADSGAPGEMGVEAPGGEMDLGGDAGGGMGGLGGGFGGGGGGGGMDLGSDDMGGEGEEGMEPEEAGPEPSYNPFEGADTPEDRLQVILDTAETLADETQDPQKVLKNVKGLIQNGFSRPDEAAAIIADLFDTNNPVLQQVSRRLRLFITGL